MASRFWLIATAIWTAGIVEVDSIIHDHRVLPILVVVPVIALATRFTPRVVVAVGALDLVIATVIGFVDPNVGAARLLSTAIAITLILGLAAWVSTLRARLEDALALAREEAASDELTGLDNRRAIDRAAGRLVDGNEVDFLVLPPPAAHGSDRYLFPSGHVQEDLPGDLFVGFANVLIEGVFDLLEDVFLVAKL